MKKIYKILLHVAVVIALALNVVITFLKRIIFLPLHVYQDVHETFRYFLSKQPQSIRQHFPYYDCNGIRYSIDHLKSINLLKMITWTLHEQAEYADIMAIRFCKEGQTSTQGLTPEQNEIPFDCINATSIGNAAYLIINHPSMDEREKAFENLNKIEKTLRS